MLIYHFLLVYFYGHIAKIGMPNMFIYGAFIFLIVFSYTELMDRNPYAILWESIKNILGLYLIYSTGDWFGINQKYAWASTIIASYFVLSTIITGLFVWFEISDDKKQMAFSQNL